jgi:glutamate formiminotransferase
VSPLTEPLFEAVPNFSEGRNATVMAAIGAAAAGARVQVLDSHGDADHNRFVLSLASTSDSTLVSALLACIAEAARRIDLRSHEGVHPRVGVADVVPIVPLDGTPMAACTALARQLGERVWSELQLPVYFYGGAALRPEAARLASIRAGGLEPDLGGPALHPSAGAVCIGSRPPLVAYNVLVPDASLDEVQALARSVRESSGGFHGVQALAFPLVNGVVQLSMNLVDLESSEPARVIEGVRLLAADAGLRVGDEEVVGLCPARHATGAAAGRLLEGRLAAAAARAGATACRALGGEERQLLAQRLEGEAAELSASDASPEATLAGAERAAALIRVLKAAGIEEPELERMLSAAARGFRAAVADGAEPERVAALDRWLDG